MWSIGPLWHYRPSFIFIRSIRPIDATGQVLKVLTTDSGVKAFPIAYLLLLLITYTSLIEFLYIYIFCIYIYIYCIYIYIYKVPLAFLVLQCPWPQSAQTLTWRTLKPHTKYTHFLDPSRWPQLNHLIQLCGLQFNHSEFFFYSWIRYVIFKKKKINYGIPTQLPNVTYRFQCWEYFPQRLPWSWYRCSLVWTLAFRCYYCTTVGLILYVFYLVNLLPASSL